MYKLDLNSKIEPQRVGIISEEISNILEMNLNNRPILIWNDRIKYIEKHKSDFDTEEEYIKHVEAMPEIINNPDYVGIHPKGKSIEFIKKIDKNMLVAVRIKDKGALVVRSSYPITEETLETYLKSGTVKSLKSIALKE